MIPDASLLSGLRLRSDFVYAQSDIQAFVYAQSLSTISLTGKTTGVSNNAGTTPDNDGTMPGKESTVPKKAIGVPGNVNTMPG